jgi:hypothetical protein
MRAERHGRGFSMCLRLQQALSPIVYVTMYISISNEISLMIGSTRCNQACAIAACYPKGSIQ